MLLVSAGSEGSLSDEDFVSCSSAGTFDVVVF
jgi:hypothetical protein